MFYALGGLISMRSLIVGEGSWSKAQKDAINSLYKYAYLQKRIYYENFKANLEIIEGDHLARTALSQMPTDLEGARFGFTQGQIPADEIDGVINFLLRFHSNKYVAAATTAWGDADDLIIKLKQVAQKIDSSIRNPHEVERLIAQVTQINTELTVQEKIFSKSLIDGSRWMEKMIRYWITFIVVFVESIGLFMFFRLGSYLARTLREFKNTTIQLGQGNFDAVAPVQYNDELGSLGEAINKMIGSLKNSSYLQKRIEENLRRSNEQFSTMVDAVKDYAIFSIDLEGYVKSWNSGAEHIKGYPANEVIGRHFSLFYTKDDQNNGLPEKELSLAKKFSHYEREAQRVKKNNTVFWANVILNAQYDRYGDIFGFSLVTRDITERKEYELKLEKSNTELEKRIEYRTKELQWRETQLQQITNVLPESICHLDMEQRFLFVNQSFCQMINLTKSEIVGKKFKDVLSPKYHLLLKKGIEKVMQGEFINFEIYFQNHGVDYSYNINMVPDNVEDELAGFVIVAHDIKKYKEIENELKKAKEEAEVANETKSAFLANMSHEIRTPLGAVLGFSELIINDEVSSAAQKKNMAEAIKRNGQLLSNVINDILDLSKVEAGKLEIEKVSILFSEIISDIESLLSLKAKEKGVALNVETEENMPLALRTDPLRLRQILLNVIGNAIKFTHEGRVDVKIKLIPSDDGESAKLAFVVHDTGTGMTQDQAKKLFAPFSQADVSTTRKFGGSGLGLILSKKLAKALGGDVALTQTEPNIGSTFVITIDTGLADKSIFQKYESSASPTLAPTKRVEQYNFKGVRVLLVEDSLDNQFIISHFLKSTGISLKVANNGQEGVNIALSEKFDLVLLDLQMPVMGGIEAMKKLAELNYQTPVIALTAHAMKEDRRQCLSVGFKDHISKPVNRQVLLRSIYFWTQQTSRLRQLNH